MFKNGTISFFSFPTTDLYFLVILIQYLPQNTVALFQKLIFIDFVGQQIHEFKNPMKYVFFPFTKTVLINFEI